MIKDSTGIIVCGRHWTTIKEEDNHTYYLLDDFLEISKFGDTNNYAESVIRDNLINGYLAMSLKEEFGDKLMPIITDLTSFDGKTDYGKVEGDIIAIPTFSLFEECKGRIPLIHDWWWLATPKNIPNNRARVDVVCNSNFSWSFINSGAIRPFFILNTTERR